MVLFLIYDSVFMESTTRKLRWQKTKGARMNTRASLNGWLTTTYHIQRVS